MANLLLSVLIFMSTTAGVYFIPEPVTEFHNSTATEKNDYPWHWIAGFETGQEGSVEEEVKGKEATNTFIKVFSGFWGGQLIAANACFKSSISIPDHGIRLSRLFILFNCLRLDPF